MSEQRGLHRFAVLLSVSTFCLIIAGGLVTSTGSGLAVPDWPLSYGQLMPPMVGGIFYEHGHRMIATFVGMLTTILAVWFWMKETRKWVKVLGGIALLAVITQGVLGGITVIFLLPTAISVSHATLAQSFFSLTIFLAIITSREWKAIVPVELEAADKTRALMLATSATILLQLILGALMRHTASGMAIPDFPQSYTNWLPPTDGNELSSLNEYRLVYYDLPPVTLEQIWIHFIHRLGAVAATAMVVTTVVHVLRNYKHQRMREIAIVLGLLVVFQFLLGALTVWTGKGVQIATAHVAVGALLLGTSISLATYTFRFHPMPERITEHAFAGEPA
ncbi:MAG: heme A synthase [Ignavibacteriae bacterium]|nr:heme A synthase [Ignavibacteriota bacterium]